MNRNQFDALTRSFGTSTSRRELGRFLAVGGLGALFASAFGTRDVDAKKHKRKKKKKGKKKPETQAPSQQEFPQPVFNQYGCLEVGQPCRGDSGLCCAGICEGAPPAEGQPDQSRCVAHEVGTCGQNAAGVCLAVNPALSLCNNSACFCFGTTAGSNVCGDPFSPMRTRGADCQKDADCVALGFPAGSACAPVSEGNCAGNTENGMACVTPCDVVLPPGQM
jgi:hypothetical protein